MYRTQQDNQHMALAQQAEALRAQQVQDEIAHQHMAEAANVANLIATDRRQRDLMGQRSDLAYGLQGMRDEGANQRATTAANARRDVGLAQQAGQNYRTDANNQTRTGIADQSNATRQRGQDLSTGAAYDRMDLMRELQDRKERAAVAVRQLETAEQAARAQNRQDHGDQLAHTKAQIQVLMRDLSINEHRANDLTQPETSRSAAAQRIGQINEALKFHVDSIVPPRQQAAGAAPPPGYSGALDANGNVPYGMRPPIPQAPAPAMQPQAQPQPTGPDPLGAAAQPVMQQPQSMGGPDLILNGVRYRVAGHNGLEPVYQPVGAA